MQAAIASRDVLGSPILLPPSRESLLHQRSVPGVTDQDECDEHESLLDVYMRAMGEADSAPVAEAA